MKKLALSLMAGSFLATTARADLPITIPTVATAITVTDTSNMGIKKLCGATFYEGKSASNVVSLTLTTANELELNWNLAYATADGSYGTAVGILLPLDAAWDIKDLSAATEIDYDVKAASATPANNMQMMIGSNIYGDSARIANAALAQPKWTALTASYQTVKVVTADMAMNSWYSGPDAATTGWTGLTYNVGTAVKNLNFQPQINWTSATVIKSGGTGTFFIRNIKIIGVSDYAQVNGVNCTGTGVTIEDFASTKADISANYLGGYWYAFSDTSTTSTPGNDSAVGMSQIILPTGVKKWAPDATTGAAIMTATLEKDVATSTYLYHPYAGWASIGTAIITPNSIDTFLDLQPGGAGGALTGISFDLYAGPALGATYTIDTTNVRRVIFKVSKVSVNDAEAFQMSIPISQAYTPTTATHICVDAAKLAQPGWYVTNNLNGTAVPFSATDISKLAWTIQIEDQSNSTVHTSANNTIAVTNVVFYGITGADGIKSKTVAANGLKASYGSQLVLSYNVSGTTAQIDVVRLDGSKVASIKASPVANQLALPVSLAHGTYLVSVRGDNSRLVSSVTSY
ncbi:MAG TPA: hypothetical protein VN931_06830 [Fibrobacteria bacterium]|nr:hypothetical protein [Fibrobacteria bacterium]